ncbi:MAG: hypothetical protein M1834_005607 [Cirrosporium novae-zelandiae]|nr:MAG: hypothetical protein M1834_005607 [Cirrosporium novae-zelandiae]
MSGLEVLGAASAALALLESALRIIGHVRKAYRRQKNFTTVLDRHNHELKDIKTIIAVTEHEKALRTEAVTSELIKIKAIGQRLVDHLNTLAPQDKRIMRQFTDQLINGSKNETILANVMDELSRAKSNLSLYIQVANVGLTCTVEGIFIVNAIAVSRIDSLVQQILGQGQGLEIAEFLRDRSFQNDNIVTLTDADMKSFCDRVAAITSDLNASASSSTDANLDTSRTVLNNSTEGQALQINGAVGEKGWWEVKHLTIKDNKAIEESIQINHGISMDVFNRLLGSRAVSI